jgi:hypothetical protein
VSVKENVPSLANTRFVNTVHVEKGLDMSAQLRILKELRCLEHPWLATKKLSRNTADTIRRHLQSLRAIQPPVRFDPWLTGFEPVLPSDYDRLAREIEIARGFGQRR